MPLHEAVGMMEHAVQELSVVPGEVHGVVSTNLISVLDKNPGYSTLTRLRGQVEKFSA